MRRDTALVARNDVIAHRVLGGDTCAAVAQDYGLSPARVRQIVLALAWRHGASPLSDISLRGLRAYYARQQSLEGIGAVYGPPAWFEAWRRGDAPGRRL
jgi:hypothetical protein